jgi:hypothetical protein
VALHNVKTFGWSWTKLDVVPADEKSLPMMPINDDVLSAGYGFLTLSSTILTALTKVELENRFDITI